MRVFEIEVEEDHMTSPAKQIELGQPAEQTEDSHAAVFTAQKTEAEGDERAALAEIKARLVSFLYDVYGVAEVIRP